MYSSRSITKLICLVLWYESTTTTDTMLMELALAQWLIMTSTMSIRISIITTLCSTMSGGAASMAAGSPERGCRRQPTGVETACGCGAAKLRSNRLSAAPGQRAIRRSRRLRRMPSPGGRGRRMRKHPRQCGSRTASLWSP